MSPEEFMQEFGFGSVEDLEERNAAIRQNDRIIKQNKRDEKNSDKIEKDRKKREEQQRKLLNQQNKASEKNTKALLGLTKGLGSLRLLGVAGAAIGAAGAIVNKEASIIESSAEDTVQKNAFTSTLGVDPEEMAKLEAYSQGMGIKSEKLHGFVEGMQRELSASMFQRTKLMENAGLFGIRIHENGKPLTTTELMTRIGAELNKSDPNRRVWMMNKLGLDTNVTKLMMRMAKSYRGFKPSVDTNWMTTDKELYVAEQVKALKDAWDTEAKADIKHGGLWGFIKGNAKLLSNATGLTTIFARTGASSGSSSPMMNMLNFNPAFGGFSPITGQMFSLLEKMISSGKAMNDVATGLPIIDSAMSTERGGKRIININLGGQQYTFSGNTSADAIRQMKEEFGPALADAIVKELTIAEK
jgi:hypothetical protein